MSLFAAAASVAVLVLAWDETTPAVRALVEATEASEPPLDSVVVLVPAGPDDTEATSLEEFLPLPELPELTSEPATPAAPLAAETADLPQEEAVEPAAAAETPAAAPEAASPAYATAPAAAGPALPQAAAATAAIDVADATLLSETLAAEAAAPTPLLPAWAAVRVLRLSSFSLPALAARARQTLPAPIWTGAGAAPAAPYAGSSAEAEVPAIQVVTEAYTATQTISTKALRPLPASPAQPLPATKARQPALRVPAVLPAAAPLFPYLPETEIFFGADLEQDDLPLAADTELPEIELPTEALALAAEEPLAALFAPAQADWEEALATLQQPAPEPAPAPPLVAAGTGVTAAFAAADPVPAALQAVSQQFDAPNLNFQVIQYARFAVPLALADTSFAVIYAPAWPTWLAAQELRQRTGRPLVLHVATLAATAAESVETATGWQADLQRQALHRADLILTETPALAQRLRHDLNLPPQAVRVVPAADAAAIAQALRTARPRPAASAG